MGFRNSKKVEAMTDTPKITPASDEEMDRMEGMIGLDFPIPAMLSIFHRHRFDRARIRELEEQVRATTAQIPARMLRFPQRRLCYQILSLEHELATSQLREGQTSDELDLRDKELATAREQIKAKDQEIARLKADLAENREAWDMARKVLPKLQLQAENAELRARCERYEGIIAGVSCNEATITDCERYCSHGEDKLHAEARAIRAALSEHDKEKL